MLLLAFTFSQGKGMSIQELASHTLEAGSESTVQIFLDVGIDINEAVPNRRGHNDRFLR